MHGTGKVKNMIDISHTSLLLKLRVPAERRDPTKKITTSFINLTL